MCLRPIDIRVPYGNGYRWVSVPCRHCIECLRDLQNQNTVKIVSELSTCGGKACFLTLTYRPSAIPTVVDTQTGEVRYSLRKSDFQAAIKRFRSLLSYNGKGVVRIAYCGEYGSHTYRPHYHCIVFGRTVEELRPFLLDWHKRFGYTQQKNVDFFKDKSTVGVGRYLAKYASKGVFSDNMPIFQGEFGKQLERPFFRNSNYLGLEGFLARLDYYLDASSKFLYHFWDEFLYDLFPRFRFNVGAASYRLPKCWRDFLFCRNIPRRFAFFVEHVKTLINEKVLSSPFRGNVRENYVQVMDSLRDRFFIDKCRASFPNFRLSGLHPDIDLLCQVLEKESADKFEAAASFAARLGKFYSRSFC